MLAKCASGSIVFSRTLSGGYSMTRKTLPPFTGSMRRSCSAASFAPELSAGEERVSHSSVSCRPPAFSGKKPCGDSPSMRTTERPRASWPVTTLRCRMQVLLLVGGDFRFGHDLRPARKIGPDERRQLVGRARHGDQALVHQVLAHVGHVHDGAELLVEL